MWDSPRNDLTGNAQLDNHVALDPLEAGPFERLLKPKRSAAAAQPGTAGVQPLPNGDKRSADRTDPFCKCHDYHLATRPERRPDLVQNGNVLT